MSTPDRTPDDAWLLRYRCEHLDWRHTGVDIVASAASQRVVWSDGPDGATDRAERRASSAADRLDGLAVVTPGDTVSTFELLKQAPGAELLAGVTLLLRPMPNGFRFESLLPDEGAVPHWERWWATIIEGEARAVAEGRDVPDGEAPHDPVPVAVTLLDALCHPVDSKELAWRVATRWAMRYGLRDVPLRGAVA